MSAGSASEPIAKAAAVCYQSLEGSLRFLLVRSHGGGWIFPKGSLEPGEQLWQTAQREAFEEAGVQGVIDPACLTTFTHLKRISAVAAVEQPVAAFLLQVRQVQPTAETIRLPQWFTQPEARRALELNRPPAYAAEYQRVLDLAVQRLTQGAQ